MPVVDHNRVVRIKLVDQIAAPVIWTENRSPYAATLNKVHGLDRHSPGVKVCIHPLARAHAPAAGSDHKNRSRREDWPEVTAQAGIDDAHSLGKAPGLKRR